MQIASCLLSLAYAKYENIETRMTFYSVSKTREFGQAGGASMTRTHEEQQQNCEGIGYMECEKLHIEKTARSKVKFSLKQNFKEGINTLLSPGNQRYTFTYTTTWSVSGALFYCFFVCKNLQLLLFLQYQTSDDPWSAGRDSDVFVVPQLTINYIPTTFVEWNETSCNVVMNQTEDGPELPYTIEFTGTPTSQQGVGFYARENIENTIIPNLQYILDASGETEKVINETKAAIAGWEYALDLADNEPMTQEISDWYTWLVANNDESSDNHDNFNPQKVINDEWYDNSAFGWEHKTTLPGDWEKWDGSNIQPHGLIPQMLAKNATQFPPYLFANISQDPASFYQNHDKSSLEKTNRISFGGGGAIYTVVMDSEKLFEGFGSTGAGNTNFGESGEFSGSSWGLSKFPKPKSDNIENLFPDRDGAIVGEETTRKKTVLNR